MKKVRLPFKISLLSTTDVKITPICRNCSVFGDNLISYQTHVATIVGRHLVVMGYYSPTTSRHVERTANQLGLTIKYLTD